MTTPPFSLEASNAPPTWLSAGAARCMLHTVVGIALENAGITSTVKATWLTSQNILKRKSLEALTLQYLAASPFNQAHTVVVLAVGKDPCHHIASLTLAMPEASATLFRQYLTTPPAREGSLSSLPSVPNSASPSPTDPFDPETVAVFLDSLRQHGGTVTTHTLDAILTNLFGSPSQAIVEHALASHLLARENGIYALTPPGHRLLREVMEVKPPTNASAEPGPTPAPSQFEVLREQVQSARQHAATVRHAHQQTQPARDKLLAELLPAREAAASAVKAVDLCQTQLTKAQATQESTRARVIQLEQQALQLPDHSTALTQAQQALTAAETAYSAYVAL